MHAFVIWLNEAIDAAQRDAEGNVFRLLEPQDGRQTVQIPKSASATLVRHHQANRRVVEMLANPLPDATAADGMSLREIAATYQQYPGFKIEWLPSSEPKE